MSCEPIPPISSILELLLIVVVDVVLVDVVEEVVSDVDVTVEVEVEVEVEVVVVEGGSRGGVVIVEFPKVTDGMTPLGGVALSSIQ